MYFNNTSNITYTSANATEVNVEMMFIHQLCERIANSGTITSNDNMKEQTGRTIKQIVIPAMCGFGFLGNILNLLMLSKKRNRMDRMERAANIGLIALALSDMLFCLSVLPHAWLEQKSGLHLMNFDLFYDMYSNAVINTFILSSTWLTVTMATSRYLAICHPLRAREIIGMTFAKCSMLIVFFLCVLCNLPRYFYRTYTPEYSCNQGFSIYVISWNGLIKHGTKFYYVYTIAYCVLSLILPLCLLTYCNIQLIRALRHSSRMRKQFYNRRPHSDSSNHVITLTLVAIILMYTILVVPSEILIFIRDFVSSDKALLNRSIEIMNVVQVINFASNFVLYCVINVHFRKTIVQWILSCFCCSKKNAYKEGDTSRTPPTSSYIATWSSNSHKSRFKLDQSNSDKPHRGSTDQESRVTETTM